MIITHSTEEESTTKKAVSLKLLTLCLLMILIVGCQTQKVKAADLKVADTPVPTRIYQMFLQDEKATTVNRYIKQYHANYDKHFWKTKYNGKTPQQAAQNEALKKIKRFVIEDKALVKAGLIKRPFAEFERYQKENQAGANLSGIAAAQKQHQGLMLKLESQYVQSHRKSVTINQKKDFYAKYKAKYWSVPAIVHYEVLTFDRAKIKDINQFSEKVQQINGEHIDLKSIQNDFEEAGFKGQYNQTDSLHDDNQYYGVYSRLASDHSNELDVIFPVWISEEKMGLLRIFSTEDGGFQPFSDVQDDVVTRLLNDKLRRKISKTVQQVKIHIDQAALSKQALG